MPPLDFPSPATPGQIYTSSGTEWIYDGAKWTGSTGTGGTFLPLSGGTINPGPLVVGSTPFGATNIQLNPTMPTSGNSGTLFLNKVSGIAAGDYPQIHSYVALAYNSTSGMYNNVKLETSVTGNPYDCWCALNTSTTSSDTSAASHVGLYNQQVRSSINTGGTGIGVSLWSMICDTQSHTGLPSSQDGVIQPIEIDITANGLDDLSTSIGRTHISCVLGQLNNTGAAVVASCGISFFLQGGSAGSWKSLIYGAAPAFVGLDTRGNTIPSGVTDPFASVRMLAGHIIDFDGPGGTTPLDLHSPGRYLQYQTTGTPRLRYMAGTTEAWSVDDLGNTYATAGSTAAGYNATSTGFSCGSQTGASQTDLSKHLRLYSTTDGINITAGQWNFVAGSTAAATMTSAGFAALQLGTGGSGGPTWTTGSAAPSSTQPVGSLYSRQGGAVGATLYVSRGGGTWAAVAGV